MEDIKIPALPTFGFDAYSIVFAVIAIVVIVLLAVLVPVVAFRSAGKWRRLAQNFVPGVVQVTGLQESNGVFTGTYKGFPVTVRRSLGANLMNLGEAVSFRPHRRRHGRVLYINLRVTLTAQGATFPKLEFREHLNAFVHTDQVIQDAITGKNFASGPEIKDLRGDWKKLRVYGEDRVVAEKILADLELQNLMSTWYYADIRLSGENVDLLLDNSNVQNKYGLQRLYDPALIVQALDICVRFAQVAA